MNIIDCTGDWRVRQLLSDSLFILQASQSRRVERLNTGDKSKICIIVKPICKDANDS